MTALLALLLASAPVDTTRWATCAPPRLGTAIGGMVASNVVVWSFNRFIMNEDWARISPASWKRNWDLGFEFDDNQFSMNQFAHPYHGSLYFNAGRANGLTFWESAPLAIVGSLMWEYLGETHRPSLNDFFNTSLGGIAVGEVTHRLAGLVRDNTTTGRARVGRELAAGILDPVGFFTRLFRGEAVRHAPNPAARQPELLHTTGQAGFARVANVGSLGAAETVSFVVVELRHGNSFEQPYRHPWDSFVIRTELQSGFDLHLAALQARGRLFSAELGRRVGARHLFEVTQDYDYLSNAAYIYGAQSIGVAIRSHLGQGGRSEFLTEAGGRAIILGAINSDYVDATGREYDYGPGFGFSVGGTWRHEDHDLVRLTYDFNWLHTVNGSDGEHFTQRAMVEARAPLRNGVGVGIDALLYLQNSEFGRIPDVRQRNPQLRAYLAWFPQ
jgi:hypothetical protein